MQHITSDCRPILARHTGQRLENAVGLRGDLPSVVLEFQRHGTPCIESSDEEETARQTTPGGNLPGLRPAGGGARARALASGRLKIPISNQAHKERPHG